MAGTPCSTALVVNTNQSMHYKARCSTDRTLLTNRLPACTRQMLRNTDRTTARQVPLDQEGDQDGVAAEFGCNGKEYLDSSFLSSPNSA